MNSTYIIILGDVENRHYNAMLANMQRLGDTKKILDNVFVLNVNEQIDYEKLRDEISGNGNGYCIVVSIKNLIAAWNLSPTNAQYLQSFFPLNNGTE